MTLRYLVVVIGLVASASAYSASFTHKGEVITTSTSVETVDCGAYKVYFSHETFPFEYENHIPSEFNIEGFYGSSATVSKRGIIQPGGIVVPGPNELDELEGLYPENRTYLAGSAVCRGNQLIVAYWSGGNCSQCEAYVSFQFSGLQLLNPEKVSYRQFKKLSQ